MIWKTQFRKIGCHPRCVHDLISRRSRLYACNGSEVKQIVLAQDVRYKLDTGLRGRTGRIYGKLVEFIIERLKKLSFLFYLLDIPMAFLREEEYKGNELTRITWKLITSPEFLCNDYGTFPWKYSGNRTVEAVGSFNVRQ